LLATGELRIPTALGGQLAEVELLLPEGQKVLVSLTYSVVLGDPTSEVVPAKPAPLPYEVGRRVLPSGTVVRRLSDGALQALYRNANVSMLTPSGVYTALMQAAQEGYLLLGVMTCMLTPYPLTGLALLYWSLGYPILKSIEVLEMPATSPDMAVQAAYSSQVQLCYWLLHCALAAVIDQLPWVLWLPFSTHARMLIAVWLQLPYFRAATMLLLQLTHFGRALLRMTGGGPHDGTPLVTVSGAPATPTHASPSALRHTRSPRANAIYSKRLQQQPGSGTPDTQLQRPHQD